VNTAFDTLAYAKKLKEAGFTEQQAEVQAEALRAVIDANLATKQDIALIQRDIALVRRETKQDIALVQQDIALVRREIKESENGIRRDMKELETTLRHDMQQMESRITLRLGGLIVAGTGVLAVLMKLL